MDARGGPEAPSAESVPGAGNAVPQGSRSETEQPAAGNTTTPSGESDNREVQSNIVRELDVGDPGGDAANGAGTDDSQTDNGQTDDSQTDNGQTDDGQIDDGQIDDGQTDDGQIDDGQIDDGQPPQAPTAGPALPTVNGACPAFAEGLVTFSVGGVERSVQLFLDPVAAQRLDGPLVFYWYGTGGRPSQALQGLGTPGVQRIRDAGGVVVAPVHINGGAFPWIGGGDADLLLMDAVVACAQQQVGIDAARIHSLGFSAGGLFAASSSFARANYLASVATYSGGGRGTPSDPNNHFAAMILHGGPNDVVGLSFQAQSEQYRDALQAAGHFAFICDHGGGHRIPTNAVASVVQFFFDHPYGTEPSPYATGLPEGFPAFCAL